MMAFTRVVLPDPFGPKMAWTSPFFNWRSTPLRISFLPTDTWRSFTSSRNSSFIVPSVDFSVWQLMLPYKSCGYRMLCRGRHKDSIVSSYPCRFNSVPFDLQYLPLHPQISAQVDEVKDIGAADQPLDLASLYDRHLVDLTAGQLGEDLIAIRLRRNGC